MKWIGQHIYDFASRFRSDVYLENVSESAQDHVVGIDANGKLYKQDVSVGDITGVTITTDSGGGSAASDTSGSADFSILGGTGVSVQNSGTTITIRSQDNEIDHDSLSNFVAAEHYRWDTDISSTATIHRDNVPTLNQNTTGSAATLTTARAFQTDLASTSTANFDGSAANTHGVTGTLAVGNGGTGAASLTDNAILLGNGSSAVEASSHLSYYTPTSNQDYLRIGDSSTTLAGIITDNASALSITVEGNSGTNAAGNDITFTAGTSTGNAAGGDFVFRSSAAGSSGTTVRASSEIAKLDNVGNLQIDGDLTISGDTLSFDSSIGRRGYFELTGYSVADGSNYFYSNIMSGNKAPFLHDVNIGSDGLTADNPAAFLRANGTVMPYAGTLKIWKGWGASNGSPTVSVAIFKYTPTADDATNASLVLVKNTNFTGAGNDNLKAFSETSFSVTVAAGDILITAIKGTTSSKTAYFVSTVEIEWTS